MRTMLAEFCRDADGLAHVCDEVGALGFVAARRCVEPHRRDHRAHDEAALLDLVRERLELVVGAVDVGVRIVEEEIDTVELDAVDLGLGRHVEHRVEVDERLAAGAALADEAGPHGIMKLGVVVCRHGGEYGLSV
jgi:hypothetical protein